MCSKFWPLLVLLVTTGHMIWPAGSTTPVRQMVLQPDFDFTKDYLEKYRPRAKAMWGLFAYMTPAQIADALVTVLDTMYSRPWYYFGEKPDRFNEPVHWEDINDQWSMLSEFLQKALVDTQTGQVFMPDYNVIDWRARRALEATSSSLFQHLVQQNYPIAYQFYAFGFDKMVCLFNDAILTSDEQLAAAYYRELECITHWLSGSELYEADYQEELKVRSDLLQLLRQKVSGRKEQTVQSLLDANSQDELLQALSGFARDDF